MSKKTYAVLILDKSGSMKGTKDATIAGFNEQVQQLKIDSKTQEIYCSLVTFNADVYEHLWNVPASELGEANVDNYQPDGGTAMRDAVGYVTQKLLNTTEHGDPDVSYLIITISDGDTNSDEHYSSGALREIIQGCEATKRWTYNYIGCGKEYLEALSRATGTPISNMAAWDNRTAESASKGFANAKNRQMKYFAERAIGLRASDCYSADSDNEVVDYSADVVLSAAPAPVIVDNPADLPQIDLDSILQRTPKYDVSNCVSGYTGGDLFANSCQVKWQVDVPQITNEPLGQMVNIRRQLASWNSSSSTDNS